MDEEKEITGRLENWVYDPWWHVIWGNIHDDIHERFFDGQWIHTSSLRIPRSLVKESPPVQGDTIETLNSRYLLGTPREIIE